MKFIPNTPQSLVLRTDFSDDSAWGLVCSAMPVEEWPYADFVSDPEYADISVEQVVLLIPPDLPHLFIFIVDQLTISDPEHPILVLDLYDEPGRTFRAIPSAIAVVEHNLTLANLDFKDYADATDLNGVYRGY